jgi:predicted metal-dependent HD superfamily phosphohydrolase
MNSMDLGPAVKAEPLCARSARRADNARMHADRRMRDELRDRGEALATLLGVARYSGVLLADSLLLQYQRWPRHYHDGRHLLACVREADAVRVMAPDPDAVAFALWFHDAVYWPWRKDNEARSAAQARESALRLGLGADFAQRVHGLVMATAHLAGPAATTDPAADWVLDIDLGILGAPPDVYDRYEHDVRREYFYVMPRAWRKGRGAVLRHFIAQPSIYRTAHYRAALEGRARENLRRACAATPE